MHNSKRIMDASPTRPFAYFSNTSPTAHKRLWLS